MPRFTEGGGPFPTAAIILFSLGVKGFVFFGLATKDVTNTSVVATRTFFLVYLHLAVK